jgi:ferritin
MINKRLEEAINEQINAELYSAYLYLSMGAYFEDKDLPGFANWMRVQFQEEQFHGLRFFDYLAERGGRVALKAIEKPEVNWNSIEAVFEEVCAHEAKVTSLINNLIDIAIEEKDHAAKSFLNWFIDEQVEEEASAAAILSQVKLVSGDGRGILMLDRELAQRVYVEPTV